MPELHSTTVPIDVINDASDMPEGSEVFEYQIMDGDVLIQYFPPE